jgi:hypothetical protein
MAEGGAPPPGMSSEKHWRGQGAPDELIPRKTPQGAAGRGTKEERKQHRIDRHALDARMKAEYTNAFVRDVDGMGRIDADRRH